MNGNNKVKFANGELMKHAEQVTYLGGVLTKGANLRAEIDTRIASTLGTWKKMMPLWRDSACNVRWKVMVFDAVIRTKLTYGLETLQLSPAMKRKLDAFQIKMHPATGACISQQTKHKCIHLEQSRRKHQHK